MYGHSSFKAFENLNQYNFIIKNHFISADLERNLKLLQTLLIFFTNQYILWNHFPPNQISIKFSSFNRSPIRVGQCSLRGVSDVPHKYPNEFQAVFPDLVGHPSKYQYWDFEWLFRPLCETMRYLTQKRFVCFSAQVLSVYFCNREYYISSWLQTELSLDYELSEKSRTGIRDFFDLIGIRYQFHSKFLFIRNTTNQGGIFDLKICHDWAIR